MFFTASEIECGADALRRYEQGGKQLRLWSDLPKSTKAKWNEKALTVLAAVLESGTEPVSER